MATSPEVRGTQSLVHTLADCWRRPSLLALEVAWRWLFGIPALWLLYREGTRILAAAPLESTGILQFSLQDPWKAAVVLSDTWAVLQPLILKTAIWLVPLLAIAWAILSGLGRSLVLRRYDPSLPSAPFSLIALQVLRVVAVGAVFAAWFYGIQAAANWTLNGSDEPNLLLYLVTVICLTLGLFTLWSLVSWVLFIAPLLVLLERRSSLSSLWRSFRLGRTFKGKLMEVNMVLGIVKLALLVLAMVLSATPLPFQSVMTGEALHQWWIAVTILYFIANDFFQVARLISFIQFWRSFAEGDMRLRRLG